MNKSTVLGAVIISVAIVVAAVVHAHITAIKFQVAIGNDLQSTAVVSTKTGTVWLMGDKQTAARLFSEVFQGWYRVPDAAWEKK